MKVAGRANIPVERRRVKYLRLQINRHGEVKAIAPLRMAAAEIDQFIQQKKAWIARKQAEIAAAEHRVSERQAQWQPNELCLHGETYCCIVDPGLGGRAISVCRERKTLSSSAVYDKSVLYQMYANEYLPKRLAQLALQHDFQYQRCTIRNQKTRWGSCSAKGNISLNWRLVQMPNWVCDYVLIHELAHTRHLNHSQAFWACVESAYGEATAAKQWLREQARINLDG